MSRVKVRDLHVGAVVSLTVVWGTQRRLRCPLCQHFTTGATAVKCRCGAVYQHIKDTAHYRVEAMP